MDGQMGVEEGGWMDGWMDGGVDGWRGGWMDGWMDGGVDGWMEGWMDGWRGGWRGGWWMDGWMDGSNKTKYVHTIFELTLTILAGIPKAQSPYIPHCVSYYSPNTYVHAYINW